MIAFSKEPFQVVEDNFHLIREHWDEVVRDSRPLDPWWELFRLQEKNGELVCFVVRKNEEVVGYAVFQLQPHFHSRNTKTAYNDAIFLRRDCRKNGLGKTFLEYCDEQLEKIGIDMIIWHVKPAVDFSSALKSIGYKHHATIYARNVGG
jgi:L-amino acid N-acyltransferase YncA